MSVNQDLFDSEIQHNIRVEFLKNGIVKRMLNLLAQSDAELTAKLQQAVDSLSGSQFNIERIEQQLASIYQINKSIYAQMGIELQNEMRELGEYEAEWQINTLDKLTPVQVAINGISINQVYGAAVARPFQGRLLSEWFDTIEESARVKIRDAVRLGIIQNETTDQIVRRIRGTRANAYKDGLIEITRRDAQSVVLTAVSHTQDVAREAVYKANEDIIKFEVWVATLDTRTCPACAELDGKRFKVSEGIRPPIHFRDRCVRVPVLKSWRELGIDFDELSPSTRASMDGQVPEDMTFATWIKKQSAERQDEVLGKERGRIFRESGQPITKFINREGKYYTLEQLRKMEL